MIDDLLENVSQLRGDAQDLRRKALRATGEAEREQLFNAAAANFQKAIALLERALRNARRRQTEYTPDVCALLEPLSQTYGSLGGTWRDARNLALAREFYDAGNEYEEQRRRHCGAMDTYNLLQRLVVRLLEEPGQVRHPEFVVQLDAAREEIQREIDNGRSDSWALADLAEVRFLCGFDADAAIKDLEKKAAAATFYESAYNGITALVKEGLGRGDVLAERLESFQRFLQRKGGIRG